MSTNSYQKIMGLLNQPDVTDTQMAAIIMQTTGRLARSQSETKGRKLAECLQTIANYLAKHIAGVV